MDPRRVEDVNHIARLVEEYRAAVGSFPLSQRGHALPVQVDLMPGVPPRASTAADVARPGTVVPYEDFVAELRAALGPDITVPVDPQRVASGRPNWYQYAYDGRAAYVAASLASERPGTRKVAPHYFKYEIALPRSPP